MMPRTASGGASMAVGGAAGGAGAPAETSGEKPDPGRAEWAGARSGGRLLLTVPAGTQMPPKLTVSVYDKDFTKPDDLLASSELQLDEGMAGDVEKVSVTGVVVERMIHDYLCQCRSIARTRPSLARERVDARPRDAIAMRDATCIVARDAFAIASRATMRDAREDEDERQNSPRPAVSSARARDAMALDDDDDAIEDMLAPRWDAHFQNYRPKMDCVHWCNRPSVWEPVLMQLQRAVVGAVVALPSKCDAPLVK